MAEITQVISTVTALPPPPDPNSPSTFDGLAYAYTVAQRAFGTDVNDFATELNAFAAQTNAVKVEMSNDNIASIAEVDGYKNTTIAARDATFLARDEAVGAVATLPDGIINDAIVSPTDTWSSEKILAATSSVGAVSSLAYFGL